MGRRPVIFFTQSIFFTLALWLLAGCTSILVKDSYYYDFYETARLLMTENEIETYRHLPDPAAKETFIAAFWEARDPDPLTEENEFKQAFEDRIEYANDNFGFPMGTQKTSRGWNTDPGRIYLVLGPPDRMQTIWREVGETQEIVRGEGGDNESRPQWIREQEWYYADHKMSLVFVNRMGRWYLEQAAPGLLTAMEEARLKLINRGRDRDLRYRFRFDLSYAAAELLITIPTDRVEYAEEGDALRAGFRVTVSVVLDGECLEKLTSEREIRLTEDELLDLDELSIAIPYALDRPGVYVFDVTAEDAMAVPPTPFRRILRITR